MLKLLFIAALIYFSYRMIKKDTLGPGADNRHDGEIEDEDEGYAEYEEIE